MSRNPLTSKHRELEYDFDEDENNEGMVDVMGSLIESSQHQISTALELTKLIIDKNPTDVNEEKIFSIFKRASKAVAENSPLKELWEKFH